MHQNQTKMPLPSLTSDDPLFLTVLDAVRRVVTSISYGLQFNEDNIEVEEPSGNHFSIPRIQWLTEVKASLAFFEDYEYYEDCANCLKIIQRLEDEPTVNQLLRQLPSHVRKDKD